MIQGRGNTTTRATTQLIGLGGAQDERGRRRQRVDLLDQLRQLVRLRGDVVEPGGQALVLLRVAGVPSDGADRLQAREFQAGELRLTSTE